MGLAARIDPAVDDDSIASFVFRSGHHCVVCSEEIMLTEEVYLLRVVVGICDENGLRLEIVESDDKDFLYEPTFFCFGCWEDAVEDLKEFVQDESPELDNHAVMECSICSSSIRDLEYTGLGMWGEIQTSRRCPEGQATQTFVDTSIEQAGCIMCIACLKRFNDDVVSSIWESGVDQEGSCGEGTLGRCWREGCKDTCLQYGFNKKGNTEE
jgi:hypothetical protein